MRYILDKDQITKALKKYKKGRSIFIYAGCFLPTTDSKGFESGTFLKVSHKIALKYINDLLTEGLTKRGATMAFQCEHKCIFLGGS